MMDHICPKAEDCSNNKCIHAKLHEVTNNCITESCGTYDEQVRCVPAPPAELYICPEHETCKDSETSDCKHAIPHDPIALDDNCLAEPCPYGDEIEIPKKIYCVRYMKPYQIELDKDLFEI